MTDKTEYETKIIGYLNLKNKEEIKCSRCEITEGVIAFAFEEERNGELGVAIRLFCEPCIKSIENEAKL